MSLIRFLVVLALGTILAWTGWVTVLLTIDPVSGGFIARAMFYLSLFLSLLGTLTIIGFFTRYWWEKDPIPFRQIGFALRQACIISAAAIIALTLQAGRLLNIWSGVVLVLLAIAIETFFLAGQSHRTRLHS